MCSRRSVHCSGHFVSSTRRNKKEPGWGTSRGFGTDSDHWLRSAVSLSCPCQFASVQFRICLSGGKVLPSLRCLGQQLQPRDYFCCICSTGGSKRPRTCNICEREGSAKCRLYGKSWWECSHHVCDFYPVERVVSSRSSSPTSFCFADRRRWRPDFKRYVAVLTLKT